MAVGDGDLVQAVHDPVRIVQMHGRHGGHAHDGIHGGTDVVGHTGQEVGLGPVGGFSCFKGVL